KAPEPSRTREDGERGALRTTPRGPWPTALGPRPAARSEGTETRAQPARVHPPVALTHPSISSKLHDYADSRSGPAPAVGEAGDQGAGGPGRPHSGGSELPHRRAVAGQARGAPGWAGRARPGAHAGRAGARVCALPGAGAPHPGSRGYLPLRRRGRRGGRGGPGGLSAAGDRLDAGSRTGAEGAPCACGAGTCSVSRGLPGALPDVRHEPQRGAVRVRGVGRGRSLGCAPAARLRIDGEDEDDGGTEEEGLEAAEAEASRRDEGRDALRAELPEVRRPEAAAPGVPDVRDV